MIGGNGSLYAVMQDENDRLPISNEDPYCHLKEFSCLLDKFAKERGMSEQQIEELWCKICDFVDRAHTYTLTEDDLLKFID